MSGLQTYYHGTSRAQALGIVIAGLHPNYSVSQWEDTGLGMACVNKRPGLAGSGLGCSCWNCHLRGRVFITPNQSDALCFGRMRAELDNDSQIAVIKFLMPEPDNFVWDPYQHEALAVEGTVPAQYVAEVEFFTRLHSVKLVETHVLKGVHS